MRDTGTHRSIALAANELASQECVNTATWICLLAGFGFGGPSASQQGLNFVEDRNIDDRLMCSRQSRVAIKNLTNVDSIVQQFKDSPNRLV